MTAVSHWAPMAIGGNPADHRSTVAGLGEFPSTVVTVCSVASPCLVVMEAYLDATACWGEWRECWALCWGASMESWVGAARLARYLDATACQVGWTVRLASYSDAWKVSSGVTAHWDACSGAKQMDGSSTGNGSRTSRD